MTQETGLQKVLNIGDINDTLVAKGLVDQVREGLVNPIDVQLAIKKMEKVFKGVSEDKEYKEALKEEVQKYNGTCVYKGNKLQYTSVHTLYDFTTCKDPLWNELNNILKDIKERLITREEELKVGWPQNVLGIPVRTVVIEALPSLEWNELMQDAKIHPPVKKQSMGIKTTFGKQ